MQAVGNLDEFKKQMLVKQAMDQANHLRAADSRQKASSVTQSHQVSSRQQMQLQTHATSLQMPINHTASIQ